MAYIYAYQIYFNGWTIEQVPARYQTQTIQILKDKYGIEV